MLIGAMVPQVVGDRTSLRRGLLSQFLVAKGLPAAEAGAAKRCQSLLVRSSTHIHMLYSSKSSASSCSVALSSTIENIARPITSPFRRVQRSEWRSEPMNFAGIPCSNDKQHGTRATLGVEHVPQRMSMTRANPTRERRFTPANTKTSGRMCHFRAPHMHSPNHYPVSLTRPHSLHNRFPHHFA